MTSDFRWMIIEVLTLNPEAAQVSLERLDFRIPRLSPLESTSSTSAEVASVLQAKLQARLNKAVTRDYALRGISGRDLIPLPGFAGRAAPHQRVEYRDASWSRILRT